MKFKFINMQTIRNVCTGSFFLGSIVVPNLNCFSNHSNSEKFIAAVGLVGCAVVTEFMPSFGVESKENRDLIKEDRKARQLKK